MVGLVRYSISPRPKLQAQKRKKGKENVKAERLPMVWSTSKGGAVDSKTISAGPGARNAWDA